MRLLPPVLWTLASVAPALPLGAQSFLDETPLDQLTGAQRVERRITPEVLVVRAVTPAVVFIETDTQRVMRDFWGQLRRFKGNSSGSGVVLTSDGFVVTNYHVVKDANQLRISFEKSIDERVYEADLLSFVAEEDLALLKIRNPEGKVFTTVAMGTSSDLMIGERVLAIGNPYGHTHTVSTGIISGLHRGVKITDPNLKLSFDFDDLIQTDASINPGNSGGPLLNINGELIGINNAVNQAAENIGFAIPIDRVRDVLTQQLISPDRYNAWLGFETEEGQDVVVGTVLPGSPAEQAGLRSGDRLLGIGNETIESLDGYRLMRLAQRPGELAKLKVMREGRTLELPIQAWDKSDGLIYERLGARVELVSLGRRGPALRLAAVLPGGPAAQTGLQEGDLIAAMRQRGRGLTPAYTFPDRIALAAYLDLLEKGTELEIEIRRVDTLYQGTLVLD
jgi:S1-C subfamily serine protease